MDMNFSLPMALAMAFLLAAPPTSMAPLPAPPEGMTPETLLEGQEELLARNVRYCLRQLAPLMPAELRASMAEQIVAEWSESGFGRSGPAVGHDRDEMETLTEAMEEEVLPALEDAGLAISPQTFRTGMQWGFVINWQRAAACAMQSTLLQLQIEAFRQREAAAEQMPENDAAASNDADLTDDGAYTPAEEEPASLERIAY